MKFTFDTASNTITYDSGSLTSSLNTYLVALNGPYQGANWKILANARENFLTAHNKKNNIVQSPNLNEVQDLVFVDRDGSIQTFYDKLYEIGSYREPPVQYNIPMKHVLNVNNSPEDFEILSSYDNNKNGIANPDLREALKYDPIDEKSVYDKLKQPINGVQIKEIEYRGYVFPRKDHVDTKETRTKPQYSEIAGTGSNGYDRNSSQIRSFWKTDPLADENKKYQIAFIKLFFPDLTEEAILNNISFLENFIESTWESASRTRTRTNPYQSIQKTGSINNLGFSHISSSLVSYDYSFGYLDSSWNVVAPLSAWQTANNPTLSNYIFSTSSISRNVISSSFSSFFSMDNFYNDMLLSSEANRPVFTDRKNFNGNLSPLEEFEIRRILSEQSGTHNVSSDGYHTFVYDNSFFRPQPRAQIAYCNHLPSHHESTGQYLGIIKDNAYRFINKAFPYLTDIISGKKPWYNSYEEFFDNIRHLARNKTVLPEFKINDLMSYYIKENNDNFTLSPIENYLSFDGVEIDYNNLSEGYNSTDSFNKFIFENSAKTKTIKIKANGVKKLLPYKGFYPQERAEQVVSLFKESYIDLNDLEILTGTIKNTSIPLGSVLPQPTIDQRVFTAIQPFFSPGILFNTIKANVAVDYPAFMVSDSSFYYDFPSREANKNRDVTYVIYESASHTQQTSSHKTFWVGSNYNFRFPFESILDIEQSIVSYKDFDMPILYPTYYGFDTFSGSDRDLMRFPFVRIGDAFLNNKNNLYKLGINNFLAEIPNFFLKDGKLNNFVSKPQKEFKSVVSGTTYYMDVYIEKGESFRSVLDSVDRISNEFNGTSDDAPANIKYFDLVAPSFYGPPTRYFDMPANGASTSNETDFSLLYKTWAYMPFAPAFTYDKSFSKAVIKYTPDFDGLPSLADIIALAEMETEYFIPYSGTWSPSSPAGRSSMKLSSSVNLFQITNLNKVKYDEFGNVLDVEQPLDDSLDVWSIQTKFETPVLNFNTNLNTTAQSAIEEYGSIELAKGAAENKFFFQVHKNLGIWSGYGEKVNSGAGLNFGIARTSGNVPSLIDICGFEEGKKDIGVFASTKTIKEAVVLIPYLENNGNFADNNIAKNIKAIVGENGTTLSTRDKNNFYFSIEKNIINDLLSIQFDQSSEAQISKFVLKKDVNKDNSIVKCIKGMLEYNVPPHLNWVTNKNIDPFIMYFLEFEHTLDQDDLSDIWQGLMPKIAQTGEVSDSVFEHPLEKNEFFHGKDLPEGIKFKVFKVKKKALKSYYDLTDSVKDDNRFKFNFNNTSQAQRPSYSYNWPYDYFSLVELVNIEAGGSIISGSN